MMHCVYYTAESFYSLSGQNYWAINFANALLVYGFVYFYFKSVRQESKISQAILWGICYNISVIGFFSFLLYGILKTVTINVLAHDLIWSVIGGFISGSLTYIFFKKINIKKKA
jgi:hypothetical protein